jgi:hypothetical protein
MGAEIDWDTRERAEELYITAGQTFERVAGATGVSVSQLKRWASDENWQERRKQYRREIADIRRKDLMLRKELLESALKSMDPKKVYAYARMKKLAQSDEARDSAAGVTYAPDRPRLFLEDMEFVAQALKEIDPEGLKVFAGSFDEIVRRFKEKHAQAA